MWIFEGRWTLRLQNTNTYAIKILFSRNLLILLHRLVQFRHKINLGGKEISIYRTFAEYGLNISLLTLNALNQTEFTWNEFHSWTRCCLMLCSLKSYCYDFEHAMHTYEVVENSYETGHFDPQVWRSRTISKSAGCFVLSKCHRWRAQRIHIALGAPLIAALLYNECAELLRTAIYAWSAPSMRAEYKTHFKWSVSQINLNNSMYVTFSLRNKPSI